MITVLRLGHRPARDKRVTTHVALTARALGADRVWIAAKDRAIERTVQAVVRKFGGPFEIESGVPWRRTLESWKGPKVHLTMYGLRLDDVVEKVPRDDLLVVVGAEKVPRDVYRLVDWNVAVGSEPHSEVAALAVFLDRILRGQGIRREFSGGRVKIRPSARGKDIVETA